jgi:hypothetical protein
MTWYVSKPFRTAAPSVEIASAMNSTGKPS